MLLLSAMDEWRESPSNPWLRRGWCFIGLAVGVGAMLFGMEGAAGRVQLARARADLGALRTAIAAIQTEKGFLPWANNNAELVVWLRGVAPPVKPTKGERVFINRIRFSYRWADPTTPGNEIVDPWGRPYVYHYFHPLGWRPETYVLFSSGPDGRHSNPATWAPGANGTASEDADNLWVVPPR